MNGSIIISRIADLTILSIAIYLIIVGWRMYRLKHKQLLATTRFSLWVLQTIKGLEKRKEKEAELLEPINIKKYGRSAMLVGGILLFQAIWRIL
jgi:TRAP-type C4-dicarboxylate transport system permease small subunit